MSVNLQKYKNMLFTSVKKFSFIVISFICDAFWKRESSLSNVLVFVTLCEC